MQVNVGGRRGSAETGLQGKPPPDSKPIGGGDGEPPPPPLPPPQTTPAAAGRQPELIDRNNVDVFVSDAQCNAVCSAAFQNVQPIPWPRECNDRELKTKDWQSRLATFNGVPPRNLIRPRDGFTVSRIFVKLLVAEFKLRRQVNYVAVLPKRRPEDEGGPSQPRNKRPNIAGDAPPPAPNLAVVAERMGTGVIPSVLRSPEGSELSYLGAEFRLTEGLAPSDLGTDFRRAQQIINSLNPLVPADNPRQHPIYKFQEKMNFALELLKTKCRSIATTNAQMLAVQPAQPASENLTPKLDQIQSSVIAAVQALQASIEAKNNGGAGPSNNETVALLNEIDRLKTQNENYRKAFQTEKTRADETQAALERERQRAMRYTNLERLNQLETAGFLVNNKLDPPAATLEACDLIVMNKVSQFWSEFDQDRFGELSDQQKKAAMNNWDPTDPACPHPEWASGFDKECPICSVIVGPEGGYSPGTCVQCIYHPGCLQQFLLSGTRLECAACNIRFNLRLWQSFKCVEKYTGLLPEIGPDGRELPKRTENMTDEEFQEWLMKDEMMILVHRELLMKIIPRRHAMNDEQFLRVMNSLPEYIDRKAPEWGLTRADWISDVKMNIRAICIPEADNLGVPPFPAAVTECGLMEHPNYPASFWRPAPRPPQGDA